MLHKIVVMLFMLLAPCAPMLAQQPTDNAGKQNTEVEEVEVPIMTQMGTVQYKGKTIPHIIMPALPKYAPLTFKNDRERAEYNRLVYNVKKVLPWAKLDQLPDKRSRDAHIKEVERGLKAQYGPALKKLTRSQGRLLIKLVNRECNQTGYAIAKAFIGPFKANLYQGIAVLFGNSLNKKYDPDGDDRYTERVVRMVEAGLI